MINKNSNPVEWVLLIDSLEEAKEHLEELMHEMMTCNEFDEEDYRIQLGHIYAHLNRCWNSRSLEEEKSEDKWEEYSSFPKDLEPIG